MKRNLSFMASFLLLLGAIALLVLMQRDVVPNTEWVGMGVVVMLVYVFIATKRN